MTYCVRVQNGDVKIGYITLHHENFFGKIKRRKKKCNVRRKEKRKSDFIKIRYDYSHYMDIIWMLPSETDDDKIN